MTNFITEVKEYLSEEGIPEYFIEFPPEFIDKTGWKEGDTINWEIFSDYAVLSKKNT